MKSIKDIESEIIDEFEWIDDPMQRYEYIIELGKKLDDFPTELKNDELLVKGCQSKVWLYAREESNRIYFSADSNTVITKGIIALLIRVLSGQTASEILNANLGFIDEIQLRSHLSSQRSNGLTSMINKMKSYAATHASI